MFRKQMAGANPTVGARKKHSQDGDHTSHTLLELLFTISRGASTHPSQSLLWSTAQSSLRASTEPLVTKPSRRWQPPRVTSTTGLKHGHLVPHDVNSQSNRTRIALSLDRMITITHGHQVPKVLSNLKWPATPSIYRGRPQTSRYTQIP